jgi:hypothetical protein
MSFKGNVLKKRTEKVGERYEKEENKDHDIMY